MTQSPCTKACRLSDGVCISCKRTIDEISSWIYSSEQEKQEIVRKANLRLKIEKQNEL